MLLGVATALLSLPPLLFPYFPAFRSVPYYSLSTRSNALFFFFFFFFPRRSAARSPRAFLEKRRRTCAVHPIEFQKISNAASLLSQLFVDTRRISQGESRYLEGKNVPADPIDQILRGISISMDVIGNRYSILLRDGSSSR